MKKFILFLFVTLFWLFALYPKDILWNSFVDMMSKRGVSIKAKSVDMKLYLLYDTVDIKDVLIAEIFKINSLKARYTVINPLHVDFRGTMKFGNFIGDISLWKAKGYILLKKPKNLGVLKRYFRKTAKGYRYEFNF